MCIVQCCAVAHAIKRKFIAQTAIGNKACRSQAETERKRREKGQRECGKRSKEEKGRQRKEERE